MSFDPFGQAGARITIAGLVIENTAENVVIQGRVSIGQDLEGLALAHALKAAVDDLVAALEGAAHLPDGPAFGRPMRLAS